MTTQEDVLLKEVDEELNQDRQLAALKRYGPWLAGAAVLFLVGIGIIQFLAAQRAAERAADAAAYDAALEEEASADTLLALAPTLGGGYETLAQLKAAALKAQAGETPAAIAAYRAVFSDESLPGPLRDYARVRAGYLALGTDPAEAAAIAASIESEALLPFAQEITGLAAMAQESYAAARAAFSTAAQMPSAPRELSARAGSLAALAAAAEAGVELKAPEGQGMATSDILEIFGNMQAESPAAVAPAPDAAPDGASEAAPGMAGENAGEDAGTDDGGN